MSTNQQSTLARRLGLSSRVGKRVAAFLMISVALGAIQLVVAILLPGAWLPILPWFVPALTTFSLGATASISLLCFGRFRFRKEPFALRVGLAFWLSTLFNLSHLLALEGILPGQGHTGYFYYLARLVFLAPCLALFKEVEKPADVLQAVGWRAITWPTLLCLLVIAGIITLEDFLPPFSLETSTDALSFIFPLAFLLLYPAAIYLQWQKFRQTQEPLVGYFLGFLLVTFWVFPAIIESGRYGIPWFSYHVLPALGAASFYLILLVEYVDLYQESQKREEIQDLLKEVSQDITFLDIDSLLKKLTEKICKVFKVDIALVTVADKGDWRLMGISGLAPSVVPPPETGNAAVWTRWIIENRRPLMIPDLTKDDAPLSMRGTGEVGARGYLGVPLLSRAGEVIGVLRALTRKPREFSDEEIGLMQQLANGGAVALENARLFNEVETKSIQLAKANHELSSAYEVKSDFLNTLAHELKTPLNVIIGSTQLIGDGLYGDLNEAMKRSIDRIRKNATDINLLINEILDLARLEAGRAALRVDEFGLREIIEELQLSFIPLAEAKGLRLSFSLAQGDLRFRSDRAKIKGILQNLLANAVNYTDSGDVKLVVSPCQDGDPANGHVSISVHDTGVGISQREIEHIFEPFYMVQGVDRKKHPGTGLGLSIVKRTVATLGGEIRAESEWGKGSTFTVTLPLIHPTEN